MPTEKATSNLETVKNLYNTYLNADRNLSHNESYKKKGGLFGSLIRGIKDTTLEEDFTRALKKELKAYQELLACRQEDSSSCSKTYSNNYLNNEGNNEENKEEGTSPAAELPALLSFIYTAQEELIRDERTYYMLLSLHSLTKDLIPYLSAEEARQLRREYTAEKKKEFAALPACQEILKLLEKQAGSVFSS